MASTLEPPVAGPAYVNEEGRRQAELRRTERERQKQAVFCSFPIAEEEPHFMAGAGAAHRFASSR